MSNGAITDLSQLRSDRRYEKIEFLGEGQVSLHLQIENTIFIILKLLYFINCVFLLIYSSLQCLKLRI